MKAPKVYEDTNEYHPTRTSRQSDRGFLSSYHRPHRFNFKAAAQQDPQRMRYNQQQHVDAINLARNNVHIRKERVVLNASTLFNKGTGNSSNYKQILVFPLSDIKALKERHSNGSKVNINERKIAELPHPTAFPEGRRELKLTGYQVEEVNDLDVQGSENYGRQDFLSNPRSTYVNPRLFNEKIHSLSSSENEGDLRALSELIGKNPNVQLQGLKKLLHDTPEVKLVLSDMLDGPPEAFKSSKDSIPVTESTVDTNGYQFRSEVQEEPQGSSENEKQFIVEPEPASLKAIQAQLDASAQARAQEVLQKAQREALAHVQQQHKAIAAAQEQARQFAIEKIRKHNEAIGEEYLQQQHSKTAQSKSPNQVAQSRIHSYTHGGYVNLAHAPEESIALVEPQAQALIQPQSKEEYAYVTVEPSKAPVVHQALAYLHAKPQIYAPQLVEPTPIYQHISVSAKPDLQHGLLKVSEDSKKAYGTEHDEVSRTKCKNYVDEKLRSFRQQFCNHAGRGKYDNRNSSSSGDEFILELNCAKIETARNFFSAKLKQMYKTNRKEFFSLCFFNMSSPNLVLKNEFHFSNNITWFNDNLSRQKRDVHDSLDYTVSNTTDYDYYYYDTDNGGTSYKDYTTFPNLEQNSTSQTVPIINNTNDHDAEMLGTAERLVIKHYVPSRKRRPVHHFHNHKPEHVPYVLKRNPTNHNSKFPHSSVLSSYNKDIKKVIPTKGAEPANIIVINNSNDNHNHGSDVNLHKPVNHKRPVYRKPKRPVHRKPSLKRLRMVSKKVDILLSKLNHAL